MDETYYTNIKALKDGILTTVKAGTTTFATHIYADYVKQIPANPTALLRLRRDMMSAIGARETLHKVTFEIWIQYRGDYSESTLNSMMSYVGEIVDALEANRTLGVASDVDTEIVDIDYSFREDRSAILHTSNMRIEIRHLRNV